MPIAFSDFAQLPRPFKYAFAFLLLMGGAVKIQIINLSIGDIFFAPFSFLFAQFGIHITYELFAILVGLFIVIWGVIIPINAALKD